MKSYVAYTDTYFGPELTAGPAHACVGIIITDHAGFIHWEVRRRIERPVSKLEAHFYAIGNAAERVRLLGAEGILLRSARASIAHYFTEQPSRVHKRYHSYETATWAQEQWAMLPHRSFEAVTLPEVEIARMAALAAHVGESAVIQHDARRTWRKFSRTCSNN